MQTHSSVCLVAVAANLVVDVQPTVVAKPAVAVLMPASHPVDVLHLLAATHVAAARSQAAWTDSELKWLPVVLLRTAAAKLLAVALKQAADVQTLAAVALADATAAAVAKLPAVAPTLASQAAVALTAAATHAVAASQNARAACKSFVSAWLLAKLPRTAAAKLLAVALKQAADVQTLAAVALADATAAAVAKLPVVAPTLAANLLAVAQADAAGRIAPPK